MILILRIDNQDRKMFVLEIYPAAEPDPLEDIVPVDVVVSLNVVQTRSRVDHQ
jgi:hypothetical protein